MTLGQNGSLGSGQITVRGRGSDGARAGGRASRGGDRMNAYRKFPRAEATGADAVFPALARAMFSASYPEGAHKLRHNFGAHPLLDLDTLARLGEELPAASVEHHRGDQSIGVTCQPEHGGLAIGETIRGIREANSRAVLKNIEQVPAYAALLAELLDELESEIVAKTGRMLETQCFVFVSSPGAVTPYHFDLEHNILLQLVGEKAMTVFPAGNAQCADPAFDDDHTGDGPGLAWRDELAEQGMTFRLEPGEAIYLPLRAPHYVRNGAEPSISLSIAWRSEWSVAEADARAFNKQLRAWGFGPQPAGRWPARNRVKSIAWRVLQRLPGID